jgi:hypothetical protein
MVDRSITFHRRDSRLWPFFRDSARIHGRYMKHDRYPYELGQLARAEAI